MCSNSNLPQRLLHLAMSFITARAAAMVLSTTSSVCLRPVKPACRKRVSINKTSLILSRCASDFRKLWGQPTSLLLAGCCCGDSKSGYGIRGREAHEGDEIFSKAPACNQQDSRKPTWLVTICGPNCQGDDALSNIGSPLLQAQPPGAGRHLIHRGG